MSLQERTLVIKNFDPERTTSMILKELCIQGGPVRNVVIKPDHAFVEYEDIESVGYTKALLEGVELFGSKLVIEPKIRDPSHLKYSKMLEDYVRHHKQNERRMQLRQQEQEMLNAYYNQPPMQPPPQPIGYNQPFLNPSLQMPNNFTPIADPQVFNYNPYALNQFIIPNQMPSTSMQVNSNDNNNLQRSRSFNHHQHRNRSNLDSKNRRRR